MKNYEQYDYIHNSKQRALGEESILIRKNVPPSKIHINTCLQAIVVSATLHKTVSICSLYIPPHDPINKKELNNLIKQLSKPFILIGDFNSHNMIWESKTMNKEAKPLNKSSIATIYASTIRNLRLTLIHPWLFSLSQT